MTLLWPWALVAMVPVALAAAAALRRPMHQRVTVGSLRLWEQTLASLGPDAQRRGPRVSVAWVALLCGAALAAAALARPAWTGRSPQRRIELAVWPSAELARTGRSIAACAQPLLDRVDPADRVRLVLPTVLGGASEYLPPDQVARRLAAVDYLPAAARELTVPLVGDAQHVYRLAPACLPLVDGPAATTIALPAMPAPLTIDAFAAEPGLAGPEGPVDVLVAVRNHTSSPQSGDVLLRAGDDPLARLAYAVGPGGRAALSAQAAAAPHLRAAIEGLDAPAARAVLVARARPAARVAMIGRDDPMLRRFVRIHPGLESEADPADADVVIAVEADPPPGVPALVINPPSPPPLWRAAEPLANIALRDADLQADHPVLAHADLSAVALRRARPWLPVAPAGQEALVTFGPDRRALIVGGDRPGRLYIAFDLAAENTNFVMLEAFVFFLTDSFAFLLPDAPGKTTYDCVTPLAADAGADWTPVGFASSPGPLPTPGLYRDAAGTFHALCLPPLASAAPAVAPDDRIAALKLPSPRPAEQPVELWPVLLTAAACLWLTGWALRAR